MAPRVSQKTRYPSPDPEGMFRGMSVFLVPKGVQTRRLKVWKQKLSQMGAIIEDDFSERVTHIFAINFRTLRQLVSEEKMQNFIGSLLNYQWLEDCLKLGEKLPDDSYTIIPASKGHAKSTQLLEKNQPNLIDIGFHNDDLLPSKRNKIVAQGLKASDDSSRVEDSTTVVSSCGQSGKHFTNYEAVNEMQLKHRSSSDDTFNLLHHSTNYAEESKKLSSQYSPPDLNKHISEIFGKLVDIYRALGDERRSFSYHKAIAVIEKLHFKIESADQVKHLPAIGKSLQNHIQEIVTTGKLSKLEHFKMDEKVRAISLFGEVWGIGPATALKLYEKGHHTLDDLKFEDSLTNLQKIGLKFFDDIKKKISRSEIKEMEALLQRVGENILPGGTESGVDTYFGLCTFPGQDLRHRIDLKVYPSSIYAFGLIAWTGNDVLNRRLRLLAESKGHKLDDTGLFLATPSTSGKRGMRSTISVSCKTEKEVFEKLGFPWLEPHERNL